MNRLRVDLAHLEQLFTVLIVFDDAGCIRHSSATLLRHLPACVPGTAFLDQFMVMRPARVDSVAQLTRARDALFLIRDRETRFAARGQMIQIGSDEVTLTCFCGAPWLYWMHTHRPQVKLGIGDFPPQDSQLDQLFLMTTEQRMVGDLEKLNKELQVAKRATESAQRAKDELFARMSHEMRTPLTGIISALALLADHELSEQGSELVDLAHSSSRNLLRVINYVLDISRLEIGRSTTEASVFSLPGLLRGVTDIVRARAMEKKLALTWHVSPQLNDGYEGDKAKLRQCLLNLVTNAIKFTATGSVTVRAAPSGLGDPASVRFEVEDTGIGISKDDQQRIFEPFFTSGTGYDGPDQGTGLGLDILRRYVEAMGGKFGSSSRLGRGSLFWLEIPLMPVDDLTEEEEPVIASGAPPPQQFRGRVLLVDDNRTNLMLGRMILQSLGLEVQEAQDGASAVSRAHGESYDLVLMDISMPGMDGVAATREIRKFAAGDELPVVALTAYASSDERDRCAEAGMNGYLTKPIVRDRLAEQLAAWLPWVGPALGDSPGAGSANREDSDDSPYLNRGVLADLRAQIGKGNLDVALDQFEAEVRTRWDTLVAAARGRDDKAMAREAHTLASTCRSLGLTAAGDHFSALEELLRSDPGSPGEDLRASEALLAASLDQLAAFRSGA